MNSVIIAKFFYIICDMIFNLLFAIGLTEKELLKSISTYFKIVKINRYRILYLYYLV